MYIHAKLAMFAGLSAMGPALCVPKQDLTSSTETAGDGTTTSASTAEETGMPTTVTPPTSTTTVDEDSSTGLSVDTSSTVGDTTAATTSAPPTPVCGDGYREGSEECDISKDCLGSKTEDELKRCLERLDCFLSCTLVGETDDKNVECVDNEMYCVAATCGDGALNAPGGVREDCDPKIVGGVACNDTCQSMNCGDGIVDKDGEDCDHLNDDSCPPGCNFERYVFLTSLSYCGNMATSDSCIDGPLDDAIKGAARGDARCNELKPARVGYTFRAWLSDENQGPFERFTAATAEKKFSNNYVLLNGTVVAQGWTGLTNGIIQAPINYTNNMVEPTLLGATVWTNTNDDGGKGEGLNCKGWTDDTSTASRGNADATGKTWTVLEDGISCSKRSHLYCFEDRKGPDEP